jgi:cytidylate kinase
MMNASLEHCLSFINSHTAPPDHERDHVVRRSVTISRQAGCGAAIIAGKLAQYLQQHTPKDGVRWTVFNNQDLMDKMLADHNLPKYLAKFLPEDRLSNIEDALAELFRVHPPMETVIKQTAETVMQLASLGGAIIIGRAGNVVTAKMPHVLHVRLVAPLEDRVERICRDAHKTPDEARRFCIEEEHLRARYGKTYFHADINDPLLYHLMINTSAVGHDNAVHLIGDALLRLGQ